MSKELEIKSNEEKERKGERFMSEGNVLKEEEIKKKRGPKPKIKSEEVQNSKEQNKFFIDVSKETESKELIASCLQQANDKSYGREIILKDLLIAALSKITPKEILKLQENSLSAEDKLERATEDYNKKNSTNLTSAQFAVKQLGIN